MTSGQFLGVLFAMLLGVLLVTNEYSQQTAAATFLANPRRSSVIVAKFAAAAVFGALFWLISTLVNVVVTPIYLHSQHLDISLTDWVVIRSVLLNLLGFVMWAIFGLGLGTLIRSQLGSVITGIGAYLLGAAAVAVIFQLIYNVYHHAWVQGTDRDRARGRLTGHDHSWQSVRPRTTTMGRPGDHARLHADLRRDRCHCDPPPRRRMTSGKRYSC